MLTCLETPEITGGESILHSRTDTIRRWATEGARAFANVQRKPLHVPSRQDSILHRGGWFGGNGTRTGYTPEGVKKLLAGGAYTLPHRAELVTIAIRHYSGRFKYISTKRACEVLRDLGCGGDAFYWNSPDGLRRWTADEMLARRAITTDATEPCNWVARAITPIGFIGGPPNKWGIYHASLCSFMLDRLAAVILLGGTEAISGVFKATERYSGCA